MSGKQCAQTLHGLKLVAKGMPIYKAAKKAGVAPSTLYRARKLESVVMAIPMAVPNV